MQTAWIHFKSMFYRSEEFIALEKIELFLYFKCRNRASQEKDTISSLPAFINSNLNTNLFQKITK